MPHLHPYHRGSDRGGGADRLVGLQRRRRRHSRRFGQLHDRLQRWDRRTVAFDTVDEMKSWVENFTSDPAAIAVQEPATAITEYVQEACGLSLAN